MSDPISKLFCGSCEIILPNENAPENKISTIKLIKIGLSHYYEVINQLSKKYLTPSELARSQRYRQDDDRNKFIICRSILKYTIAKETGMGLSQINFKETVDRKPYLPDNQLYFNIAHSGNYALIAIGVQDLGVDVELVNNSFYFDDIVPTVFNSTEIDQINTSDNKSYTFFQFWTRKEAVVKAIGKGIDDNLCKISVTDGNHLLPSHLLNNYKKIKVYSFDVADDYIGALAISQDLPNIETLAFRPTPTVQELQSFNA